MNLAFLALLPAALLIDRLFGELPSRVHPVCMMGALASRPSSSPESGLPSAPRREPFPTASVLPYFPKVPSPHEPCATASQKTTPSLARHAETT